MAAKKQSAGSICPTTQNPVLRNDVARQVEAIREAFPKGISAPVLRALDAARLTTLESLTKATEADVARLHGMGPKAIQVLKAAPRERRLSFAE